MVLRLGSIKKSRFIVLGIVICVVVLIHLEMQLATIIKTSEEDARKLSDLEGRVDEAKRFNLKTEEMISIRELKNKDERKSVEPVNSERLLERKQLSVDQLSQLPSHVVTTGNLTALQEMFKMRFMAKNGMKELWWHLRARLKAMKQSGSCATDVDKLLEDISFQEKTIIADLEHLEQHPDIADWKKQASIDLANLVQKRLRYLQNPKDCKKARKLICDLTKPCGYGCQIHHVGYCFVLAYATQRTLILESHSWQYADNKGWDSVFMPLSDTCTVANSHGDRWSASTDNVLEVKVPIVEMLGPRPPQMPMAFPKDLAEKLLAFHGYPFVWWAGQLFRYLLRPNKQLADYINEKRKEIGFKRPIIGVHVRRTDKVGTEAAFHSIEEYMTHVKEWYDQRAITTGSDVDQRRVFLATDDAQLLAEAKRKYSNYQFVSDNKISQSAGTGTRYSLNSLFGVIFDIQILAETDFLVCTFSSQVCRLAYELMQPYHVDASQYFHSLDDVYYYGGMQGHHVKAIYLHLPQKNNELDLYIGDTISIAGNEKDGTSKGRLHRTGKYGEFLSYKTEEIFRIEDFPTYKEVVL